MVVVGGVGGGAWQDAGPREPGRAAVTIKTYRAKTIADALVQIKKELGRDAVILHTRTIKAGGWFGFRRSTFTEITATTSKAAGEFGPPRLRVRPTPATLPTDTLGPLIEAARERRAEALATSTDAATDPAAAVAPALVPDSPLREVAQRIIAATERTPVDRDIAAIKRMVGQVLKATGGLRHPSMPEALFDCYQRLLEAEVATELADELVGAVRDELDPSELADPAIVHQSVLRRLAAYIQTSTDSLRVARAPDGRPTTIALIGPTGVGKTTTIAKLAATYKLRHGKRVGLITGDTYRIAAVDQLRTYATIIGLPFKVVLTPAEMASACDALSENDIILIDTAGRSPRDSGRLDELHALVSAARPHQTHLVLSSTASHAALTEAARLFAPLGCDRVIFTKLDEAVNFGVLVNLIRQIDAKLSFVTTGQEVPDHIEPGNADRLARFVMGADHAAAAGAQHP